MKRDEMKPLPIDLTGTVVILRPLDKDHTIGLAAAADDARIWPYLDEPIPPSSLSAMKALVDEALQEQRQGQRLPFTIFDASTNSIIGSISFIDIQPRHRQVEIGWAWLDPAYWGTGAAREAANLLLRYAFDTLGAIRVSFKTDSRNIRSNNAILALGATQEGTFRNHRILHDGYIRDSVFYSIIIDDWPSLRDSFRMQ